LVNRIIKGKKNEFKSFLEDAITLIPIENYKIASKIRSVLSQSKEALPKKYLIRLFDILIFNKRKNDRKLACWIANQHFNNDINKKLLIAWDKFHDPQLIVPLLENGKISIDNHYYIIEEILEDSNVEDWLKRKFLLLLAKKDFSQIEFIKDSDPVTYIYISTKFKKKVDNEFILDTISNIDDFSKLGLIIWCIGKMKKRKLLLDLVPQREKMTMLVFENMKNKNSH